MPAKTIAEREKHYPRTDPEYLHELVELMEKFKYDSEIAKGLELLEKFRQEGRPFGKTVFDESFHILLLKDKVMIVEGGADIQGTSVIVRDGNAYFVDFSRLSGMKIEIESIEPLFEAGEFRGFRMNVSGLGN